jgi:prepilin-type N-terminal cleavage/methylation domain-containing protein
MTRRAITLIELLAVIAISSTLLLMATIVVRALTGMDSGARANLERQMSIARLADRFRSDIRDAVALAASTEKPVDLTPAQRRSKAVADVLESVAEQNEPKPPVEKPFARITLPDGRQAEYVGSPGMIFRIESQGDEVRRRDWYPLPGIEGASVEVASRGPPLVALSLKSVDVPDRMPSIGLRLLAQPGANRRFTLPDSSAGEGGNP